MRHQCYALALPARLPERAEQLLSVVVQSPFSDVLPMGAAEAGRGGCRNELSTTKFSKSPEPCGLEDSRCLMVGFKFEAATVNSNAAQAIVPVHPNIRIPQHKVGPELDNGACCKPCTPFPSLPSVAVLAVRHCVQPLGWPAQSSHAPPFQLGHLLEPRQRPYRAQWWGERALLPY